MLPNDLDGKVSRADRLDVEATEDNKEWCKDWENAQVRTQNILCSQQGGWKGIAAP